MDELELDLNEDQTITNGAQARIKDLSSKVKNTADERDQAKAAAEASETARIAAEKERDFYANLSIHTNKFPNASEHIEEIKEKVMGGYSTEDAIVSVLNAKGALMPQQEETVISGPIAGGSAPTQLDTGSLTSNMTQEERRTKLMEADGRGELVEAIRNIR